MITTPNSPAKYWSMKPPPWAEKPKSMIRRSANGTARVAPAAATSEISAPRTTFL